MRYVIHLVISKLPNISVIYKVHSSTGFYTFFSLLELSSDQINHIYVGAVFVRQHAQNSEFGGYYNYILECSQQNFCCNRCTGFNILNAEDLSNNSNLCSFRAEILLTITTSHYSVCRTTALG